MAYVMSCRDAGFDECDYEAWAETKDELMELATAHGKEAHGIDQMTPEVRGKIEDAVREI